MLIRSFMNWSSRARAVFFVLLAMVAAVALLASRSIADTEADLDLFVERCILEIEGRYGSSGFFPVSECSFSRVDAIHLGAGTISIPGHEQREARDVSLRLMKGLPTSAVNIEGRDLAIGNIDAGPGTFDVVSQSPGDLAIRFFPYPDAGACSGDVSLGEACQLTLRDYELWTGGARATSQPGEGMAITFVPLEGAGRFVDETGGFKARVRIVDRPFEFDGWGTAAAIHLVDYGGKCGGVSEGTIVVGSSRTEVRVPLGSCVRPDADEYQIRYLGAAPQTKGLHAAITGRFRSLQLNQMMLVSRPTSLAVLIGLFTLIAFGALAHADKRLLGTVGPGGAICEGAANEPPDLAGGKRHFFVSHSHTDKRYARRLAQSIREHGFSVWLDDDMRVGAWSEEIRRRIRSCAAFLAIVTPRSLGSRWVDGEIACAMDSHRDIIPLLLEGHEVPLPLHAFQFTDVSDGDLPPEEFYRALERYATKGPSFAELSEEERLRIETARRRIEGAGSTVFRCTACGFPVSYDTMSGAAAALLFGLPSIGGVIVYSLLDWKAAMLFAAASLVAALVVLQVAGELVREPSRCQECGRPLASPLPIHIWADADSPGTQTTRRGTD